MKKNCKKLLSLLLVAVMILSTAACNKKSSTTEEPSTTVTEAPADTIKTAEKTKITFWHIIPEGSVGYDSLNELITNFNKVQDEYEVEQVGYPFLDYFSKMTTAFAGGVAPDVFLYTMDDVPARAAAGTIMDLSPYIKEDSYDMSDLYAAETPGALYNNDYYALPFSSTCRVLYYNLDLFEAAGLTEADVPKTWDELYTVAHKMDIVDNGVIKQLGFDPTAGMATYFQFLWQSGLDFFDKDGNPVLTDDANKKVLQWVVDFNKDYPRSQIQAFSDASKTLAADGFVSGRMAMMVSNDSEYATLKTSGVTFNYGVAPMPIPENGTRVNWSSCWSIEAIQSQDTAKMAGAWEFIKYMLQPNTMTAFYDSQGWLTASRSANEKLKTDPIMEAIINEIPYATEKKYFDFAPKWHDDWNQFMQEATAGTPADQVLKEAQEFYIEKSTNYKSTH